MDNDFLLDYDEIIRTIRGADVITFRFVIVNQRLLIDNRSSAIDPPLRIHYPVGEVLEALRLNGEGRLPVPDPDGRYRILFWQRFDPSCFQGRAATTSAAMRVHISQSLLMSSTSLLSTERRPA
jgi:hypothetical protein